MNMDSIRELQAYGFIFFIVFLCVVLYGYYYHLYKSERTGRRNYEKYGKLVLDDELKDEILEPCSSKDNAKEEL